MTPKHRRLLFTPLLSITLLGGGRGTGAERVRGQHRLLPFSPTDIATKAKAPAGRTFRLGGWSRR